MGLFSKLFRSRYDPELEKSMPEAPANLEVSDSSSSFKFGDDEKAWFTEYSTTESQDLDLDTLTRLHMLEEDEKLPEEIRLFISYFVCVQDAKRGTVQNPLEYDNQDFFADFDLNTGSTQPVNDNSTCEKHLSLEHKYGCVSKKVDALAADSSPLFTRSNPPSMNAMSSCELTSPRSQYKLCSKMQKLSSRDLKHDCVFLPPFNIEEDYSGNLETSELTNVTNLGLIYGNPSHTSELIVRCDGSHISNSSSSNVSEVASYVPSISSSRTSELSTDAIEPWFKTNYLNDRLKRRLAQSKWRSRLVAISRGSSIYEKKYIEPPKIDLSNPNMYCGYESMAGPYPYLGTKAGPLDELGCRRLARSIGGPPRSLIGDPVKSGNL